MPENASFQGCFTEVSFATSEGNQLSYFQNTVELWVLAHAVFFRLSMKGKLDVYLLRPFGKKLISIL